MLPWEVFEGPADPRLASLLEVSGGSTGGGGGGGGAITWVNADAAGSPYTPANATGYLVDPTGGVVFSPTGLTLGQGFAIKVRPDKSLSAANSISISAQVGLSIEQPGSGAYVAGPIVLDSGSSDSDAFVYRADSSGNLWLAPC